MSVLPPKPELLAPAGSMESFFAAMEKGADAVYAGLHDFSARARAKNFTLTQMEKMLGYAHASGRRIYVTLNTLVKEQELRGLTDTLAALEAMRVDGVIIQDMAIARLIRNHFPGIPLHASTQMTIHNAAGVKMLEKLGFQRAVLARELAIDEIAAIAASTSVEIETFVHGALCFSISGQCFFSSYLGGHSGNRGRCAQPCRRLYSHRGKQGHFFSTSDLSAIDLIPELIQAGVKSLKIEGRMKSAEYVATVVEAYRLVLDSPVESRKDSLGAAKEILKSSFGRTPTKGFLASQQPDDIANPWQKGGTGKFIGQIKTIRGKRLIFETRSSLHVGDRLRVQPKTDMAGQAWTLREIFCNRKKVMEAAPGSLVEVDTPFTFEVGDSIYKVSSNEAFTLSDNACQRRLEAVQSQNIPCNLRVFLEGEQVRIIAQVFGDAYEFHYPVGILEPARSDDMEPILRSQFAKTGSTPFLLESLTAADFPSRLIPSAAFKELRRQFYRYLETAVTTRKRERQAVARTAALRDIELFSSPAGQPAAKSGLTIVMEYPKDWRFALQQGADTVALPLSKAAIHQLAATISQMRGGEDQVVWQLPFMLFDRDIPLYEQTLRSLYKSGFRRFEASNLSHFGLLHAFKDLDVSTGYRCFSLNSQALQAWRELGANTATLYLEDDGVNMEKLLAAQVDIQRQVTAYAPLPVMTTKIKIKDVHTNAPLQSDRGETYCVSTRDGLQTIVSTTAFCLTARYNELRRAGCDRFVVDLSCAPRETWNDVVAAFKTGRALPGSTEFNYAAELV